MSATRKIDTAEFTRDAVSLSTQHGYGVSAAARNVGVHATRRRKWKRPVEHQGAPALPGHGRLRPEQAARQRLRQDKKRLRMEREILKKAALFFANETRCRRPCSLSTQRDGRCQCCVR